MRLSNTRFWRVVSVILLVAAVTSPAFSQPPAASPSPAGSSSAGVPKGDLRELTGRADQLRKQGKRKEAIRLYEQAMAQANPAADDAALKRARYYLGLLLLEEGRAEEALEHLKQSADGAPSKVEGWNALARARLAMGDESGAVELWRQILREDPKFVEAHVHLARLLKKQGKLKEARTELELALKQKPDDKVVKAELEKLKPKPKAKKRTGK